MGDSTYGSYQYGIHVPDPVHWDQIHASAAFGIAPGDPLPFLKTFSTLKNKNLATVLKSLPFILLN